VVAGLGVSGQLDLVVQLLQDLLVQLDLGGGVRLATRQNHGPAPLGGPPRPELDLRGQRRTLTGTPPLHSVF